MGRFAVNLSPAAISGTTRYVLIDRSDTSAFPHGTAEDFRLEKLYVTIVRDSASAAGLWLVKIGVVEEVDADNGSVTFPYVVPSNGGGPHFANFDLGSVKRRGVSMEQSAVHMLGSQDQNDSANWQTDTILINPSGTNVAPGQGDLVVEAEEIDGTVSITLSITAIYDLISAP